jgi:hypothetical protein
MTATLSRRRSRASSLAVLLLATALPCAAHAADAAARSFYPADFVRFTPRSALEMVQQVPGFVIAKVDAARGLGEAAGNVLINGQRVSDKTNDIETVLGRIPAGNVMRIDIVDGSTLNVPGLTGQVANVVVRASAITGQFSWRPEFRAHNTSPLLSRGDVSVSGRLGRVEYTVGAENAAFRSGAGGPTWIYAPGGALTEVREETWHGDGERPRLTGRFVYTGPGGDVGNLNATYRRQYYGYREDGLRTAIGQPDRVRRVEQDDDTYDYEIGGDYSHDLGPGRLRLVGLNHVEHLPSIVDIVERPGGAPTTEERSLQVQDTAERIARAEYRWRGGGSDWQVSAEAAFNGLDYDSSLARLDSDGVLAPVPIEGGQAKVREQRFETIATWGRALTPNLTVQASAGGEFSRLTQVGAGGLSRSFWRPKGSLSATWKASPDWTVNLKLDRRVGQLDFFDFVASVDLLAAQANAGNPQLVPEQSWAGQVEAIRNLGPLGQTGLRAYGRLIDDIVDFIPIGATGQSRGNIDHARVVGLEWKSTITFDPLGWRGAKLDATLQWEASRVRDPLTGRPRPISNNRIAYTQINFRYDIPGGPWATGVDANMNFPAKTYRLNEVGRQWEGPVFATAYVEDKDVAGLTVRAYVTNWTAADSFWFRTVYAGRRTGPALFTEKRDRAIGPIFGLTVRGRF